MKAGKKGNTEQASRRSKGGRREGKKQKKEEERRKAEEEGNKGTKRARGGSAREASRGGWARGRRRKRRAGWVGMTLGSQGVHSRSPSPVAAPLGSTWVILDHSSFRTSCFQFVFVNAWRGFQPTNQAPCQVALPKPAAISPAAVLNALSPHLPSGACPLSQAPPRLHNTCPLFWSSPGLLLGARALREGSTKPKHLPRASPHKKSAFQRHAALTCF